MLKIKDNVNLSILEKYGFKCITDGSTFIRYDYYGKPFSTLCVLNRVIEVGSGFDNNVNFDVLDVIYVLIQDGLVERVE